jgi:hypothetical protein
LPLGCPDLHMIRCRIEISQPYYDSSESLYLATA